MPANLILIAARSQEEGDRIAHAMTPTGTYAFVFAGTGQDAVQLMTGLQPDLVIAALLGDEGIALCRQLREQPASRLVRVLLLIERDRLNKARTAGANTVLVQPASALLVALEAKKTLERVERRAVWVADRRTAFRGGRRFTDIGVG